MWIVASTNNLNFFKSEIKKKILDVKFYYPKIKSQNKEAIKNLLGNYLFCYSDSFNDDKNFFSRLRSTKGLKKILFTEKKTQKEIIDFINFCKFHEDRNGIIKNTFFKNNIKQEGRILNGPFSNYIFSLIEKDKKKIQVLIGEIKVSISDQSKFNYSTI